MGQFVDKLKRISRDMPQPMGFRTAQLALQKPKMLLVASFAGVKIDNLADYVVGADAGLLHISDLSSSAQALQKISRAMPDIPWGGYVGGIGKEGMESLVKASFDFVVFPAASTSLEIYQDDKVDRVLQVEASLAEGLLRAIDELPVDAVFVDGGQENADYLTWQQIMVYRRFSDLLTKPLLVSVPVSVTANELIALWEARVDAVVVEVKDVGRFKVLRQTIDELTLPQRKQGGKEVSLPYLSTETGSVEVEEEE